MATYTVVLARYRGTQQMDFARGVADLASAVRRGGSPTLSARYCLHVNEIVLAVRSGLFFWVRALIRGAFDTPPSLATLRHCSRIDFGLRDETVLVAMTAHAVSAVLGRRDRVVSRKNRAVVFYPLDLEIDVSLIAR